MELDNLESLINYFFGRIKDILKSNNVYVGINSEYQKLMTSFIGTVTHESVSNFIKINMITNKDYREDLI